MGGIVTPTDDQVRRLGTRDANRWSRDSGVTEMIDYLRDYQTSPGRLTSLHLEKIKQEYLKCQASFEYAARNYFWIVNKQSGKEMLFRLWDSQELILESLYELRDKGLPQKLIICKSRQLGCSTLLDALMLWKTVFFRNQNAIIVSHNPGHAGQVLFSGIVLYILDRLPWWLKPMETSREIFDGVYFANKNKDQKEDNPGNESRIFVQAANQKTGVGQGVRITAAHISEIADYQQEKAREIIEGDLGNAIVDEPGTIAVIESTGKIAESYFHRLWKKCVEGGEDALWHPRFFPWFFDKSHFIPPVDGWAPQQEEIDIKAQVLDKWLQCDNADCAQMREGRYQGHSLVDSKCPTCAVGRLRPKELTDGQLRWWERRRSNVEDDEASLKTLMEEQALTPEDAFQTPGRSAFPMETTAFATKCTRDPLIHGFMDDAGIFHGADSESFSCINGWCDENHRWGQSNVTIWEFPQAKARYAVGADVGAGLGDNKDYSVAVVIKMGVRSDRVVARLRTNTMTPNAFATPVVFLAQMYNNALLAIEANKHDACSSAAENEREYDNLYQQRAISHGASGSRKFHWYSTPKTKPNLFTNFVQWLRDRCIEITSENCVSEMKSFVREGNSESMGAPSGQHDDEVMATMIGLYCGHEDDWMETSGHNRTPQVADNAGKQYNWVVTCSACEFSWGADSPKDWSRCPVCQSLRFSARKRDIGDPCLPHPADYESNEDDEPTPNTEKSLDAL